MTMGISAQKFVVHVSEDLFCHVSVVEYICDTYGHLSLEPLIELSRAQHRARERYGRKLRAFAKTHESAEAIELFRSQHRAPIADMAPSVWVRLAEVNGWNDLSQKKVRDLFERKQAQGRALVIELNPNYFSMFRRLLQSSLYGKDDTVLPSRIE